MNLLFLFFYHKDDDITLKCYEQLCKIEGAENVQSVSNTLECLPNTFNLNKNNLLFDHGDDYWMYDGLIYKYVLLNKELILSKDVIITLEYDVWWNFYSRNWLPDLIANYDLIVPEMLYSDTSSKWAFFNRDTTRQTGLKKGDLLGARPLAVTCSKPECLVEVSEFIYNNPVFHKMVNCELRFGTLFKILGARIREFPFKDTIKWYEWINENVKEKQGIFHPIKNIDQIS